MSLDHRTTLDSPVPTDDQETLDSPPSDSPQKSEPPRQFDRFRLDHLLGQGGMGQVWEAWDPQLERQVAIKRLLTADPSARRRFLREARLQATIVHPGICPVYEVGQDAGEPYLVMPRLDGVPLDHAVEGEPLEYKLELLRQVAEAVHAAHQQGLIHRDLKPANILVESPIDALPRPVVLDFGIARPMEGEGLTVSGEIVGTPAYMAPEQVEGKIGKLDRRTDVYALGATLYRLLSGRPPHRGEGTPLLLSIVQDEPERLPPGDVPPEVEAIVFRCLEKEKNRRYDSAKALAEDLGRYLAGEPVLARPVTRWVRLNKWMRRHKMAVRITSAATLVALAGLAWGGWSAWRSEGRQDIARQFGAQIEEIEALARYSHLVPLHDVRADHEQLRQRLDAIRPSLDDGDPVIRSLAAHALGRGHLALDELETAREFLEKAYALAPDNVEIASDLGRALSELYRDRLTTVEQTRNLGGRESLREQLSSRLESRFRKTSEQQKQWQRTLEDPARDLLAQHQGSPLTDSVELDALRLFHEGTPEEALELLAEAPVAPSWAYERLRLEGDIRRSWAVGLAISDKEPLEARHQMEQARRAYNQAQRVAPSHAALLRDDTQTVALLVGLDLVAPGEVEPLLAEASESLHRARTIHPEDLQTWLWTIRLESLAAEYQQMLARDPTEPLKRALDAGKKALEIDSQASVAWLELGKAHGKLTRWLTLSGKDATAEFEQAVQAFDRVAPEERNYRYYVSLGALHMVVAAQEAEHGLEAAEIYQTAIHAFRSAAEIHSAPFAAQVNLAGSLFEAAGLEGMDSNSLLHQAVEILELAHALRPDHMAPFYYLGLCRLRLAQEGDPLRSITRDDVARQAQADFEKAIELAPESFQPWVGLGELLHLRAIAAHHRGDDPAPLFAHARQAHARALEFVPDQPAALLNLAWTAYFEGKFALRSGRDPAVELAEAEELCRRSLDFRRRPRALLCLASVWRMEAEHSLNQGVPEAASVQIAKAQEAFREILTVDASHPEAHRSLARLLTLEAQRQRQTGEDATAALAQARTFLDLALKLGDSADFHLADASWYLEQARWLQACGRDFTETVTSGRRVLTKLLQRTEASRTAMGLEADFEILGSQHPPHHQ